jgi:hypothetical protein
MEVQFHWRGIRDFGFRVKCDAPLLIWVLVQSAVLAGSHWATYLRS